MSDNKLLTRSEFQAMVILWSLPGKGAFTKDILAKYDDPKPAYTTVATFLKILTTKGYIKTKKVGNTLFYVPRVTRNEYRKALLQHGLRYMYDNDPIDMLSFMASNLKLTNEQLDEITTNLQQLKK